ncbi:MAG: hypothetical protein JXO22_08590 [Phycisphaerae bacterium]|nr:hypothetical protein [Phycisphaerae bacterium]
MRPQQVTKLAGYCFIAAWSCYPLLIGVALAWSPTRAEGAGFAIPATIFFALSAVGIWLGFEYQEGRRRVAALWVGVIMLALLLLGTLITLCLGAAPIWQLRVLQVCQMAGFACFVGIEWRRR